MRTLDARRLTQRVLGGSIYVSLVLADEPVFYYRLEELSGSTIADQTDNSNDGEVIGATLGVAGRLGLAASFDGINDYLTAIPVGDLSALTVECWAKIPKGVGGGASSTNIWGVVDEGSSNIIQLVVNSNGTLALRERTGSGTPGATTTATAWDDGEWHHIVALLQAGTLRRLWIDGSIEAAGTAQGGSWTLTSTPLTFGGLNGRGTPETFVECTLDEIAFYDKLLTRPQIVSHYQAAQ